MQDLIYLLRHGAVATASPRRFLGRTDLPLTTEGRRQALVAAERLQTIAWTRVLASPLQRAVQTAALVSGRGEEAVERVAAFSELDLGAWEGCTVAEVQARFPGGYEARGRDLAHFRPPGGESFEDVANRAYPALLTVAGQSPGPLLIVAHAGVNRTLLSRLTGRPLQRLLEIPQHYCAVNILRTHADGGLEVVACNQILSL